MTDSFYLLEIISDPSTRLLMHCKLLAASFIVSWIAFAKYFSNESEQAYQD